MSKNKLENISTWFLVIIISGILALFIINSIAFTGYNGLDNEEIILFKKDNILFNIIGFIFICIIYYLLYRLITLVAKSIKMVYIIGAFMIVSLLIGVYWVRHIYSMPVSDSLEVSNTAVNIRNGNYEDFGKGGYISVHPNQLGLLTLVRVVYKFCGINNWYAFQYLNVIAVPLIILSGTGIAYELMKDRRVVILTMLMLFMFSPLYFYTSYTYNDELSLCLMMLSVWFYCIFIRKERIHYAIVAGIFMAVATTLRQNMLIPAIGTFIVIVILSITRKKCNYFVSMVVMVFLCVIVSFANKNLYKKYYSSDTTKISSIAHIPMGQREGMLGPGWYNFYIDELLNETDGDIKKQREKIALDIRQRSEYFLNNPKYMIEFYTAKINSQWNVPLYQGLAMNVQFEREREGFVKDVYADSIQRKCVEEYANIFHLIVMSMSLLYIIYLKKKREGLEKWLISVIFFGGFLFSIMWEAKSRYVFPYFVLLIPYAACGLNLMYLIIEKQLAKIKK